MMRFVQFAKMVMPTGHLPIHLCTDHDNRPAFKMTCIVLGGALHSLTTIAGLWICIYFILEFRWSFIVIMGWRQNKSAVISHIQCQIFGYTKRASLPLWQEMFRNDKSIGLQYICIRFFLELHQLCYPALVLHLLQTDPRHELWNLISRS